MAKQDSAALAETSPAPSSEAISRDKAAPSPERAVPPQPSAATNLLLADIVVQEVSRRLRKRARRKALATQALDGEHHQDTLDSKTVIRSLGLYGASRLAHKSTFGLGLVATGLVLKTLYDRGTARQQREATKAAQKPPQN